MCVCVRTCMCVRACVHACLCMCLFLCKNLCVYLWRSDVNSFSSITLHLIFFWNTISLWTWNLLIGWIGLPVSFWDLLVSASQCWNYRDTNSDFLLYGCWGSKLRPELFKCQSQVKLHDQTQSQWWKLGVGKQDMISSAEHTEECWLERRWRLVLLGSSKKDSEENNWARISLFLWHRLPMWPRQVLNSQSFCLSLQSTRIAGLYYHK